MIQQKVDYIQENPVAADFVNKAVEWRLNSVNEKSPLKLDERL